MRQCVRAKVCENALIDIIERIEAPKSDVSKGNRFTKCERKDVAGPVGFEPKWVQVPMLEKRVQVKETYR